MPGPLQPSALANAGLLRTLDGPEKPADLHALAEAVGQPRVSNLTRSLERLEQDGLVEPAEGSALPLLTPDGHRARLALDFAEGLFDVPEDHILVAGEKLRPHPDNPRETMDPAEVATLADTIEADGRISQNLVIGPVEADGAHTIFIGHRRHAAWELLKHRGSPVAGQPLPCVVRADEPGLIDYLSLVENGQRANLNHLERACALARLAAKRGYSNPTLAKVTGIDLRTVQESLKVVREATPESLAKYRAGLKPGADRATTFTWEQLRDSVKDSKPKPSLDLPPKMRLPLIELAWAIAHRPAAGYKPGFTRILTPQPGGAYHTLRDKRLVDVGFEGGQMFACISPEVTAWLAEIGFPADRNGVMLAAQANVVGPLEADVLAREDKFATEWLNVPTGADVADGDEAEAGAGEPDLRTDADDEIDGVEAYAALAGQKVETPSGEIRSPALATVAADPELAALAPDRALVLVELAHKIMDAGVPAPNQPDVQAAEVDGYFNDPRAAVMVHAKLIVFTTGPRQNWIAYPTKRGAQWLADHGFMVDGQYVDTEEAWDAAIDALIDAGNLEPYTAASGLYVTSWLNVTPKAAPEAKGPANPGLMGDSFSRQVAEATRREPGADQAAADVDGRHVVTPREATVAYDVYIDAMAGDRPLFFAAPDEATANELGDILARTGMFDQVAIRDRNEKLLRLWGEE